MNTLRLKKWLVSPLNKERAAQIAEEYGLPFFLAMLLEIRGAHQRDQIEELLGERSELSDPFLTADMYVAAERIRRALDDFEKIAIYGDYDADGVTATAILYSYLESCGGNVIYYIPEREGEGYGLNKTAVEFLHNRQVNLIITVDNGIASLKEAQYVKELGMELIVTDHHRVQEALPDAVAVVDPHRPDDTSPYKHFAGVGVAFKLIMALEGDDCDLEGLLENYADLVAVGTIGDVVPLTGENRVLVRKGLQLLSRSDRLGVRELLEHAGMLGRELSAGNVAFSIVPRINATGRIGSPGRAVRLLVSEDPDEARELAEEICDDNDCRRQIESELFQSALEDLREHPERLYDHVLVVAGREWHHGVIGIVAARLVDHFGKPCMVISYSGEQAKGSGRSVDGFSLFEALCSCSELFTKFGGHPMAAGISLPAENIEAFRVAVNRYAATVPAAIPTLRIDCKLRPATLTPELPGLLQALEPFGTDNPPPLFGLYSMKLEKITAVGEGKHLRLTFSRDGTVQNCMLFHTPAKLFPYEPGDELDLAVTLDAKEYRGEMQLSVFIRDMKLTALDTDALIRGKLTFEKYKRGDDLTLEDAQELLPNYTDFALLYRFLRERGGWSGGAAMLLYRLDGGKMGYARLLTALEVFAERGLLMLEQSGEHLKIELCEAENKVNLLESPILCDINQIKEDGVTHD
ncbi:MAG: single-stranded-DNA-specific exonuclease RecJ [Clostridium sp.]|uniref:single-stranded-DNA-specific exonuclease RecJ n=1 Tax=Clostridium sp. TaxID=1506 RepID=UPI0029104A6C|nr:single-stranded-DNA-specific exonuclease RecJ [Clostridium sp.]MDU7337987.1 single-stranded-DNA-specific exonuclease RecJ [Clostridium sp.]